ncbi:MULTISPECIES: DinB family protein [Gulosibacter]|uniref:DinB family protein n=1 Tax=Gulosibacter TaxID=256818 RepID=UPI000F6414A0|nr:MULTISPECIES: DinB family protein [Gulosibacter]
MNGTEVLLDLATRPRDALLEFATKLSDETLNSHPAGHDNSPAWLIWHAGREIDAQLAPLAGTDEVWPRFREQLALGELGDTSGYGQTAEQARSIVVHGAAPLLDYFVATTDALLAYLGTLSDADLDDVIDTNWNPPVTRGARLVSIIDDAAQHIGQAAYAVGAQS